MAQDEHGEALTTNNNMTDAAPPPPIRVSVKNANQKMLSDVRKIKILKSQLDEFMNVEVMRRMMVLNPATGTTMMIREHTGVVTDLDLVARLVGKHHPVVTDEDVIVHVVFDDGDKEDMLLSEFKAWRTQMERTAPLFNLAAANHALSNIPVQPKNKTAASTNTTTTTTTTPEVTVTEPFPYVVLKRVPSRLQQVQGKYEPTPSSKRTSKKTPTEPGVVVGTMGGLFPTMLDLINANLIQPGPDVLEIFLNDRQGRREGQTHKALAELLPNGNVIFNGQEYADTMAWVSAFKRPYTAGEGRVYRDWRCIRYRKYPFPILQDLRDQLLANVHHEDNNNHEDHDTAQTTNHSQNNTFHETHTQVYNNRGPIRNRVATGTCDVCHLSTHDVLICESCECARHVACMPPHQAPHRNLNEYSDDDPAKMFLWVCDKCQAVPRHRLTRRIPQHNPSLGKLPPEALEAMLRDNHLVTPYPCPLVLSQPQDVHEQQALNSLFKTLRSSPLPPPSSSLVIDHNSDVVIVPFHLPNSKHPSLTLGALAQLQASKKTTTEEGTTTTHVEYVCPLDDDVELDRAMVLEPFSSAPLVDANKMWSSRFEAVTRSARVGWVFNAMHTVTHVAFVPPPRGALMTLSAATYIAYFAVAVQKSSVIQIWRCQEETEAPTFLGGIDLLQASSLVSMEWCDWHASPPPPEAQHLGLLVCATSRRVQILAVSSSTSRSDKNPWIITGKELVIFQHEPVDDTIIKALWRPHMSRLPSRLALCITSGVLVWDIATQYGAAAAAAAATSPHPTFIVGSGVYAKTLDCAWCWNDENGLVTLHQDGMCRIWDITDTVRGPVLVVDVQSSPCPISVQWPRGSDYLVVARDSGHVSLVQILDARVLHLPAHLSRVTCMSQCPRLDPPVICTTAKDGNCLMWRIRNRFTFTEERHENHSDRTAAAERIPSKLFQTGAYACSLLGRISLVPGSTREERLITTSVAEATLPSNNDVIFGGEEEYGGGLTFHMESSNNVLNLQAVAWGFAGADLYVDDGVDVDDKQDNDKRLRHSTLPYRHYEWIAYGGDFGVCRLVRVFIDVE